MCIITVHNIKTLFSLEESYLRLSHGIQIFFYAFIIYSIQEILLPYYLENNDNVEANRIIKDLIKIGFFVISSILFLRYVFEVNLLSILTHSAIITAIVGLALQDTIQNIFSGIIINIEKPFKIGDWVEIDSNTGLITEINWRYTKIKTMENHFVHIPNSTISSKNLINMSKPVRAVIKRLYIGTSYEVPPLKVKKAIMQVLNKNKLVMKNPEPKVRLIDYEDFSIKYRIDLWISDYGLYPQIIDDIYSAIWYQFKKYNIEIPFPIRTIINKDMNEVAQKKSEIIAKAEHILRELPLFADVKQDSINMLIEFSHLDTYYDDAVICKENEIGKTMFFIISGEVQVFKQNKNVATLKKGDFFGEFSLFTDERRSATVKSFNKSSLLEIDREGFSVIFEKEPEIIKHIEKIIENRITRENYRIDSKEKKQLKKNLFNKFKNIFGIK